MIVVPYNHQHFYTMSLNITLILPAPDVAGAEKMGVASVHVPAVDLRRVLCGMTRQVIKD
jgi:hypothetical protein